MIYGSLVRKRETLMQEIELRVKQHRPRKSLIQLLLDLTTLQLKKENKQFPTRLRVARTKQQVRRHNAEQASQDVRPA